MENLEYYLNLSAIQLRNEASERWPGKSGLVRKLKKRQLAQALADRMSIEYAVKKYTQEDTLEEDPPEPAQWEEDIPDPKPEEPVTKKVAKSSTDPLGSAIVQSIMEHLDMESIKPDMDKVNELIKGEVAKQIESVKRVSIEVQTPSTSKNVGAQHEQFETLLKMISAGVNVMMVGPAGSGKTHTAKEVARALDKRFFSTSVGPQSSKVDFMGYMDANGNYVRTNWREAFENGGVFLVDELDAGNPQILTTINQSTENGTAGFPDGQVSRHPDFIVIASANTYGRGADRMYVGRQQLDAATNDRFAVLEWEYDEKLEREISGNDEWVEYVQSVRKAVQDLKIRHIVSPRASINGAKLLKAGMKKKEVEEMVLFKGLDKTSRDNIKNKI